MDKFQITIEGYKKLKAQLEKLKNEDRPNIIKQIATARELGDLRENSEYHSAKDRQGFIEAQIADYEDKFIRAEVVDINKIRSNKIQFGATVNLENLDNQKKIKYKIVSEFESNIDEGLISINSPSGNVCSLNFIFDFCFFKFVKSNKSLCCKLSKLHLLICSG